MAETKRLDYVDWLKAIGIFLIVLGHCLPAYTLPRTVIYAFHVPLFAFAGGLLSKPAKTIKECFLKVLGLLKRMGIPYLIWFLVSCVPYMLPECPFKTDYSFSELVEIFFLLNGRPMWNAALWFIPCYFVVNLLFVFLSYLTKGNKLLMLSCGFVSFLGIIKLVLSEKTINFFKYQNIFSMHNVFLLFGFFCLGYALKDIIKYIAEWKQKPHKNYLLYIALGVFITSIIVCALVNRDETRPGGYYGMSVLNLRYNDIYVYILMATLILISLTLTCALLPKNTVTLVMSQGSFFIMATHYLFFRSKFHTSPSYKAGKWEASMHLGMREGVYITVILVAILLILYLFRKRFKWFSKMLTYFGI